MLEVMEGNQCPDKACFTLHGSTLCAPQENLAAPGGTSAGFLVTLEVIKWRLKEVLEGC